MNRIARPVLPPAAALGALLFVLSCQDAAPPAPADPAAAAKARQAAPAALAQAPSEAPFAYSPVGKRDPFRSYLSDIEQQGALSQLGRPREVTEKYDLEQYHLTGVVTGPYHPKAMVEDPKGHGHVVRVGSRLGKNGGRVARIAGHELVVVEKAFDATGKPVSVSIVKHLPRAAHDQTAED